MSASSRAGRQQWGYASAAAAGLAGAAALATVVLPQLQFAYGGTFTHVVLETAASLIALLAGFLVFGRLRRSGHLNDLMLACALAALGLLNFCLLTMPALAEFLPRDVIVWVLLLGRSAAAAAFAVAAFAPAYQLRRPGLVLAASVAGGSAAVLATAATVHLFAGYLAHRLAAALTTGSANGLGLLGHPVFLTLQLATTVFYGVATVGFGCRSRKSGDEFLGWLAVAAVLAAFSHLNYSLYPRPYTQFVHAGDIFRICSYVILLIGSMREISSYWHAQAETAVLAERQRIARDLHDGLAQELACLTRNLQSSAWDRDGLLAAVERARCESRRVVSHLAPPGSEPLEAALARVAAEVAERFGVRLQFGLPLDVEILPGRQDALVRVAREAVNNAARHSGADQVSLTLERDGLRLRLRVTDRGRGFDPAVTREGFGLVSMRQRVRSVGGELRVSSVLGGGSEVEVTLDC